MPNPNDNPTPAGQDGTSFPGSEPGKDMKRDRKDKDREPSKEAEQRGPSGVPNEGRGNTEHSGQQAGRHSDGDEEVNPIPSTKQHVPGGPDEDTQNPG
jgi:hypothetical protein